MDLDLIDMPDLVSQLAPGIHLFLLSTGIPGRLPHLLGF